MLTVGGCLKTTLLCFGEEDSILFIEKFSEFMKKDSAVMARVDCPFPLDSVVTCIQQEHQLVSTDTAGFSLGKGMKPHGAGSPGGRADRRSRLF